jgi:hypothetical protein
MFFEVLNLTYHIPITIEVATYRVLLGTPQYSSRDAAKPRLYGFKVILSVDSRRQSPSRLLQSELLAADV